MIKTIVVALDGSSNSERAFDFACDLASRFDAALHIVHVVSQREVPEDMARMAEIEHLLPSRLKKSMEGVSADSDFGMVLRNVERQTDSWQILEKLGRNLLQSSLDDARERGVAEPVTALLRGEPAVELLDYIKSVKADTVVSGSRGLGSLRQLMVGSVSQKLAQHARCACIIVK